jgi:DNA gyrase subunit A
MANSICSFNLAEVCATTIELKKNPEHDKTTTLVAPDFSTGAQLIFNPEEIAAIYKTGRGSFKLRSNTFLIKKTTA